jgi:hypothetical protein
MVSTGSAAHRAGLIPGDLIEQSTFLPVTDLLQITIRRDEKQYAIKMHPKASMLASTAAERRTPAKAGTNQPSTKLTPSQIAWTRIKNSEIVFVQDMSAKMRAPLGDTGLSQWDWCAGRIADFAESLSKDNPMGFTLIQCYQLSYAIHRDQNPASLRQHLSVANALGAANITTPLENIVNEYIDNHGQKPLLIMVFTDGLPERGESLEVAAKLISERVKYPDQVRLVLFQIGDDPQGTAMMRMLDDDLTYVGYKYDVVDFVKFEDLQESGVSRALLDAYERPRAAGKTAPPPVTNALTAKLDQVHKEIAAAH